MFIYAHESSNKFECLFFVGFLNELGVGEAFSEEGEALHGFLVVFEGFDDFGEYLGVIDGFRLFLLLFDFLLGDIVAEELLGAILEGRDHSI